MEFPKVFLENKSDINDGDNGKSSWCVFDLLLAPLERFATRLRFNTSLKRTWEGLGDRVYKKKKITLT